MNSERFETLQNRRKNKAHRKLIMICNIRLVRQICRVCQIKQKIKLSIFEGLIIFTSKINNNSVYFWVSKENFIFYFGVSVFYENLIGDNKSFVMRLSLTR